MKKLFFCTLFLVTVIFSAYSQENATNNVNEFSNLLIKEEHLDKQHWLYFGWEEDHPKAISLMGGAVYPRRPRLPRRDDHSWGYSKDPWHKNSSDVVVFLLSVDDSEPFYPSERDPERRKNIQWNIAENYLPFPTSAWEKDKIKMQITHFGKRILNKEVNAVYSEIQITNTDTKSHEVKLIVNGNYVSERVFPTANFSVNTINPHRLEIPIRLNQGEKAVFEFVLPANGKADISEILKEGGFGKQYSSEKKYIDDTLVELTHPVSLPDNELINLWQSSVFNMLNATVKTPVDYEQRGSGGNVFGFYQYDRVFAHDVPDMVVQYIIEGLWDIARKIMVGATYETLSKGELPNEKYNDAIPKYLITMAQYLQVTGDIDFFTEDFFNKIKTCAHAVQGMRAEQLKPEFKDEGFYGLIEKGGTLDNGSEYLVVDNFAALHGFAAYKYICDKLGKASESIWAETVMTDLNNSLNRALDISMEMAGTNWYNACFSFDYDSVLVSGPGNWFGTTMMMPTFPWNAYLKGFELGGTWKDYFDNSVEKWIQRAKEFNPNAPEGAFGAWWNAKYGSIYNAGMAMSLLFSDKHRTLVAKSIEWLMDNKTAPYYWGESFHPPEPTSNWTRPEVDLETWGLGFIRQALLQLCVSVHVDGTVILGRGIPDYWLNSGKPVAWKNVHINNGKKIDFSIHKEQNKISIQIRGDKADGKILVDIPVCLSNIAGVTVSGGGSVLEYDNETGKIWLTGDARDVVVELKR